MHFTDISNEMDIETNRWMKLILALYYMIHERILYSRNVINISVTQNEQENKS